jgi:hypothetical protein
MPAAGEPTLGFGLEKAIQRADGELTWPEVPDARQDDPVHDVAVDLDRLWGVVLPLLDLCEPDPGHGPDLRLAVEVALGLGRKAAVIFSSVGSRPQFGSLHSPPLAGSRR